MFASILVLVLVAAAIHVARSGDRTPRRIGEIVLLYVLVGYCGIPMLAASGIGLLMPDRVAEWLGFPAGNPFQEFASYMYLAMALLAVLALRYRRTFLIAPAVCWAVFFAGATFAHLKDFGANGHLTHGGVLAIFLSHGLISVLLVGALLASGLLKETA